MNQYTRLTLKDRAFHTEDLMRFGFEPESPIDYDPGEYATIGTESVQRQYSIASHPSEPRIEFFIERVEGGELSPKLFELGFGDQIWMWDVTLGDLGEVESDFHFMIATVTGVSPYLSVLKEFSQMENPPKCYLLHGASYPEEFGSLEGKVKTFGGDWLTYVQTISRPFESPRWNGETGRVEDVLRKHLDNSGFPKPETAAYLTGHPKMIEKARGVLERTRIGSVHEERYFGTDE